MMRAYPVVMAVFGVFIGCVGLWVWHVLGLQVVDYTAHPLTAAEARMARCPIDLPDSARNAQWRIWHTASPAHCVLVRFEAPPPDCRLAADRALAQQPAGYPSFRKSQPVVVPVAPVSNSFGGAEPWFDINQIKHGEVDGENPKAWVDYDRQIFYYRATD